MSERNWARACHQPTFFSINRLVNGINRLRGQPPRAAEVRFSGVVNRNADRSSLSTSPSLFQRAKRVIAGMISRLSSEILSNSEKNTLRECFKRYKGEREAMSKEERVNGFLRNPDDATNKVLDSISKEWEALDLRYVKIISEKLLERLLEAEKNDEELTNLKINDIALDIIEKHFVDSYLDELPAKARGCIRVVAEEFRGWIPESAVRVPSAFLLLRGLPRRMGVERGKCFENKLKEFNKKLTKEMSRKKKSKSEDAEKATHTARRAYDICLKLLNGLQGGELFRIKHCGAMEIEPDSEEADALFGRIDGIWEGVRAKFLRLFEEAPVDVVGGDSDERPDDVVKVAVIYAPPASVDKLAS